MIIRMPPATEIKSVPFIIIGGRKRPSARRSLSGHEPSFNALAQMVRLSNQEGSFAQKFSYRRI